MLLTPFTQISSVAQFVPLRVKLTLCKRNFLGLIFNYPCSCWAVLSFHYFYNISHVAVLTANLTTLFIFIEVQFLTSIFRPIINTLAQNKRSLRFFLSQVLFCESEASHHGMWRSICWRPVYRVSYWLGSVALWYVESSGLGNIISWSLNIYEVDRQGTGIGIEWCM